MAFATGMQIGKYELGKKLGEGGFGFVFVARDTGLDRDVAVKFLHPHHTANGQILQRFLQEARTAAKIVHPGVVTIHECAQVAGTGSDADGTWFIAMELLHGESLASRLARSGRLAPPAAMEIVRQVASALEAAHRAGIIHRDLKPDNIFLVEDPAVPSGERAKVLDFGIAKLAQAPASGVQTASMMVFGTPRYMSPEQCKSAAHIDHRSDIYALGVILYELVCGAPPFEGEFGELIAKHQLVAPPRARETAPEVSEPLDNLIADMLAKEPGQRPQSMDTVQRSLMIGGARSTGLQETLLPEQSLQRFTPPSMVSAVAPTALPVPASPTTLSAATGSKASSEPPRGGSKKWIVAGVLIAGAAAAGVGVYATRSNDATHEPTAPAATTTAPPPAPAPAPPPQAPPPEEKPVVAPPPTPPPPAPDDTAAKAAKEKEARKRREQAEKAREQQRQQEQQRKAAEEQARQQQEAQRRAQEEALHRQQEEQQRRLRDEQLRQQQQQQQQQKPRAPDMDGDGIPDISDACPSVPGVRDPDPLKNGCPKSK